MVVHDHSRNPLRSHLDKAQCVYKMSDQPLFSQFSTSLYTRARERVGVFVCDAGVHYKVMQ